MHDNRAHDPQPTRARSRRFGPEPLGDRFTAAGLRAQLQRHPGAPIKGVLLDQSVLAGVGNIYANEALHLASHPARPAGSLTALEARRLHRAIRRILALAIETVSRYPLASVARPPVTRITPEELAQRQQSDEPVTILDVRGRSYRTSDSKIAGAIRIDPRELSESYQTLSHEQTIVAYCT